MLKPSPRPDRPEFVTRALAALREAMPDLPRPGALGAHVVRALLVLATVPAGCVAEPMPATARIKLRAIAKIGATAPGPARPSHTEGGLS